jgi:hypothetical protein
MMPNIFSGECPWCAEVVIVRFNKEEMIYGSCDRKCKHCNRPIEAEVITYMSLGQGDE